MRIEELQIGDESSHPERADDHNINIQITNDRVGTESTSPWVISPEERTNFSRFAESTADFQSLSARLWASLTRARASLTPAREQGTNFSRLMGIMPPSMMAEHQGGSLRDWMMEMPRSLQPVINGCRLMGSTPRSIRAGYRGTSLRVRLREQRTSIFRFVESMMAEYQGTSLRVRLRELRTNFSRSVESMMAEYQGSPLFLLHLPLTQAEIQLFDVHFKESSPFYTHPIKMWTFMIGMYTNYAADLYYAKCWFTGRRCPRICYIVGSISGSLASAAFLSILVPRSLESKVFISGMLLSLIYFDVAYNRIVEVARRLFGYISNGAIYVWNRIIGRNNEANLPN